MCCCSKIAEAEAAVSVNEKKWLVMHVYVYANAARQALCLSVLEPPMDGRCWWKETRPQLQAAAANNLSANLAVHTGLLCMTCSRPVISLPTACQVTQPVKMSYSICSTFAMLRAS